MVPVFNNQWANEACAICLEPLGSSAENPFRTYSGAPPQLAPLHLRCIARYDDLNGARGRIRWPTSPNVLVNVRSVHAEITEIDVDIQRIKLIAYGVLVAMTAGAFAITYNQGIMNITYRSLLAINIPTSMSLIHDDLLIEAAPLLGVMGSGMIGALVGARLNSIPTVAMSALITSIAAAIIVNGGRVYDGTVVAVTANGVRQPLGTVGRLGMSANGQVQGTTIMKYAFITLLCYTIFSLYRSQ